MPIPQSKQRTSIQDTNDHADPADGPETANDREESGNRKSQSSSNGAESPARATEEAIEYADPPEMASSKQLMRIISNDINLAGLVGEKHSGLLLYLIYTSRLLDRPLSAIIRGKSSSGKDEVQRVPLGLMPPEHVIEITSLTNNALYYDKDPNRFRHKIIAGGELSNLSDEDSSQKTEAIRQFISNGRLTKQATIKMQSVYRVVEGPIAWTATTTLLHVPNEDLNRVLQVYTDPSPEQTREVMKAKARQYSGEALDTTTIHEIREKHYQFQNSLKPFKVIIPFSDRLANLLPDAKVESRRVYSQVLSVVEAIALMYQHQRKSDDQGRLKATAKDYEIARLLLLDPLHRSIGVGASYQIYKDLRKKLHKSEFDSNQALETGFNHKSTRDRALKKLMDEELLEQLSKGSSHKPAKYRWLDKDVDELVLPSVAEVTS